MRPIELKLFIDGVEVKSGDRLVRGDTSIVFDKLTIDGEISDSRNNRCNLEYMGEKWKFCKVSKKYAQAIIVTKDNEGQITSITASIEFYSKKPEGFSSNIEVYWPASDYLDSYGFFKVLEKNNEDLSERW